MNVNGALDLKEIGERAVSSGTVLTATDGRDALYNSPDGWEVDEPWRWWEGYSDVEGYMSGPRGNPIPGAGYPLGSISAAVTRCTSIIVDPIAGSPWRVYKGYDQLPDPQWIVDPQGLRLDERVMDPERTTDIRESSVEFWSQWLIDALWFGDGFVYAPVRNIDGSPLPPLWHLAPNKVAIKNGRYWVDDVELSEGSVIHLRGLPPFDRDSRGTGVLTRHGAELELAAKVRRYAASTFGSGVPSGYLKVNTPGLNQEQADNLKQRWMLAHGKGSRSIAVLNAVTDFTPISVSPVDAQLDRAREWSLRDVALAFGVPAYMLGIPGDSSTYANVESRMIELRTFTLLPWIRRIEATLDAQLPRGTELKVNMDGLMRADTKTRYEAHAIAINAGFATVDEVRALEDRPPLPEPVIPEQLKPFVGQAEGEPAADEPQPTESEAP